MNTAHIAAGVLLVSALGSAHAVPVVTSASGSNPAGIQAAVDAYRASLGALNPNVAGSVGAGRREINWDGVPDAFSAPNNLPANFFNVNSPRGAVFATPGSGFQVSGNAAVAPVRFGNINASYPNVFQTFSAQRLFTALGSNVTDVSFFVPGSAVAATVRGFGSVFADVDLPNITSMQFFDQNNVLLDTLFAPASANGGLSFLGALYADQSIGRVRITSGNAALGAPESSNDLVVMDDFIYAEPIAVAIPEPETAALLLAGLGIVGLATRRAKRRETVA